MRGFAAGMPMPGNNGKANVAILGAGIMGACLALFLARHGLRVTLYDKEPMPLRGASRWNEGKIHLGYLYGADPTLSTARRILPGGLAFAPLLRELLEIDIDECITPSDDLFLIHRDSVVGADAAWRYYQAVSELVRRAPGAQQYLADARLAKVRKLTAHELEEVADPRYAVAGFRIPERSVQTNWIADRLCNALADQPGIEHNMPSEVKRVYPLAGPEGRWSVHSSTGERSFDWVVNALWQNRAGIDQSAGIEPPDVWSSRYRLALFVRTAQAVSVPSAVLAVGPFGDIKNYNNRDFYLSWYPAGLVHESDNRQPKADPCLARLNRDAVLAATRAGLVGKLRGARAILDASAHTEVAGGWVYAQGRGKLSSPKASLHRRDSFGLHRLGRYLSIDTGKYSLAPWLARSLAHEIAGH